MIKKATLGNVRGYVYFSSCSRMVQINTKQPGLIHRRGEEIIPENGRRHRLPQIRNWPFPAPELGVIRRPGLAWESSEATDPFAVRGSLPRTIIWNVIFNSARVCGFLIDPITAAVSTIYSATQWPSTGARSLSATPKTRPSRTCSFTII